MKKSNASSARTKRDADKIGKARRAEEAGAFDEGFALGDQQFPAQYHARSAEDRAVGLKQDYVRFLNQFNPDLNARYQVTDKEIDQLVRRYDELDLLNFERYISGWFNVNDPTHQRLINELYPQYFERRLDQIEANLEVQRRVAHLRLLGPRSADDLRFAYFLETGVITLPTKPVFEPSTEDNEKSRGLFNPFRLFDQQILEKFGGKSVTGAAWKPDQFYDTNPNVTFKGYSREEHGAPDPVPGNFAGFGAGRSPKAPGSGMGLSWANKFSEPE